MIKRSLYFSNPAYLHLANEQLVIERKDQERKTAPIEDLGMVLLDHPQITITQALLAKLLANNVAVITCNETHHPTGMFLNLDGHSEQRLRFQQQIEASVPLKKQLWQQTISAKISNQAAVFRKRKLDERPLLALARSVRSGDSENCEAQAAVYYWKHLFPDFLAFKRDREGDPPNNLLNYGYAVLRALVAKSLVGSGLLPTFGIFHRSKYNAYCLADDIMEPYRPYVDREVCNIVDDNGRFLGMTPTMKQRLLSIPQLDVSIDGQTSPLLNAVQRTTASLVKCFDGSSRQMLYPDLR